MKNTKYDILKEYEDNLMLLEDLLGCGSTNNIQLNTLCTSLFGKHFLGVFSSDEFPKKIKNNQLFIINTEPSNQKGLHWVAFFKKNKRLFGYDTFNRDVKHLSNLWRNINCNTR